MQLRYSNAACQNTRKSPSSPAPRATSRGGQKQHVAAQDLRGRFHRRRQIHAHGNDVQAIVLFDEYRGKGLEADEKSLAFRFSLQDTQNTLQDDVVDAV
jgi:hypothetical protein